MPSFETVEWAVILAGLILPAWPIWRIRRRGVSVPISALLSCWFLLTLVGLVSELDPRPDGFGAGVMVFASPALGLGYARLLAGLHAVTRRVPSPGFERRDTMTGLIIWAGSSVLCFVCPFVALPPARKGDSLLLYDYLFFCGPVLFLAMLMSVIYLFRWFRLEPGGVRPSSPGQSLELGAGAGL